MVSCLLFTSVPHSRVAVHQSAGGLCVLSGPPGQQAEGPVGGCLWRLEHAVLNIFFESLPVHAQI